MGHRVASAEGVFTNSVDEDSTDRPRGGGGYLYVPFNAPGRHPDLEALARMRSMSMANRASATLTAMAFCNCR